VVGHSSLYVPNSDRLKKIKEFSICKTSVQSYLNVMANRLPVIPSVWQPNVPKIIEATYFHCFPKPFHLSLRASLPAKLLIRMQHLVEVTGT
jgi:hypothetical protein